MKNGINSRQPHFDNLSYISDGRDGVSYNKDPYAVTNSTRDANELVLRPIELKHGKHGNRPIYAYRPGQNSLYAYNNPAFSDISGIDGSRGLSDPSLNSKFYSYRDSFESRSCCRQVCRLCSKYWYIFGLLTLIIFIAIGVAIGLIVFRWKQKFRCDLSCDESEKLVHLNSTHCECQFINECEFDPPVCQQLPCLKLNGTGYECLCTPGFRHPPTSNNLAFCEDINECENTDTCGKHQICTNTIGNYICSCENGYEADMSTGQLVCQDKNECIDPTICSNARCINTNGSFICECNPGFIRDQFNPLHCEDINECLSSDNCTGTNELCENIPGSFRCLCARGYRRNEHGSCININECTESNTTCDINSRCEDRNGSFACCISTITNECIECGYDYTRSGSFVSNRTRHARMTDGEPVEVGHFPWIAALSIKKEYYNSEPRYVCMASLISSWNIITAAHCLDEQHFREQWSLTNEPSSFKDIFDIRIGVHNISANSTDFIESQSYSIENFTIHSGYQPLNLPGAVVKNDIAIIKLTKRIERSPNKDWICLPTTANVQDQTVLKVVSYGKMDDDLIQQQLNIRVLHNQETSSECQRQFSDIADDAFCAISTNHSSLLGMGDSGAPAMLLDIHHRWHIGGIMSKTGIQKAYSAMTNVSMHIEWLNSFVER